MTTNTEGTENSTEGTEKPSRLAIGRLARRVRAIGRGAKTGGLDAPAMIRRLELAAGEAQPEEVEVTTTTESGEARDAVQATLAAVPAERIVDVDVRDVLRAGGEPFGQIMAARKELRPGGVLRVRAIFEPAPLYFVLAAQGLDHWTEQLAEDDWRVWFFQSGGGAAADAAGQTTTSPVDEPAGDGDVVILDVRGLEPPEPMVRTLEALETLPAGKTLVQVNVRVPRFLLPMLENRGYRYKIEEQGPTLVRTFIRRA